MNEPRAWGGFGRALRHRNYRLFFAGQIISLAGGELTTFATVWMVYRLTHSPIMLGLIGFFGRAPAAVIAPIAGVLVDRWNRRRTVIVTQVAAMLQSAALALFALTGRMTVWHLLTLGAVQAVINAFDTVARQSFLAEMIDDRADLPNAVALNSLMKNSARMLGPVMAAGIVGFVGEGWCFTIDGLTSLPVIAALFAMHVAPRKIPPRTGGGWREMKEGLSYVADHPVVRAVLLLFTATSFLAGSHAALLPLIAGNTLHGGPHTLGVLLSAAGFGALTGALILASRTAREARRQEAMIQAGDNVTVDRVAGLSRPLLATIGLGCAFLLLELARSTLVAAPLLFVVGASSMVVSTSTSTLVQTTVDADKRGRVTSLWAIGFFAGAPLGALLEGELAKLVGPVHMFAIVGVGCLLSGLAFARMVRVRRMPPPSGPAAEQSEEPSPPDTF
jgi:MFS family permease